METNYHMYYYVKGEIVRFHFLRNDHLLFILDKIFRTSPRVMGCHFSFSGDDCAKFCTYLVKFVCVKSTYLDKDFVDYFTRQYNTSIDVIRFANLNDDVSDSELVKLQE